MENINHNPKCINKTCEGGMIMRNPSRPVPCTFCNPSYRPERTRPYTLAIVRQIAIDFHRDNTYEEQPSYDKWWAEHRQRYVSDYTITPFKPKVEYISPQDPPDRIYMTAEQIIDKFGDSLTEEQINQLKSHKS